MFIVTIKEPALMSFFDLKLEQDCFQTLARSFGKKKTRSTPFLNSRLRVDDLNISKLVQKLLPLASSSAAAP